MRKMSVGLAAYVASLLLMSITTLSDAALTSRILNRLTDGSNYLTTQELWLNQTLDHFSPYVLSLSLSQMIISPSLQIGDAKIFEDLRRGGILTFPILHQNLPLQPYKFITLMSNFYSIILL